MFYQTELESEEIMLMKSRFSEKAAEIQKALDENSRFMSPILDFFTKGGSPEKPDIPFHG